MAKYVKIYNSANDNVAYCRVFEKSEVTINDTGSYYVTFNDGVVVDAERDFVTFSQVLGGAEPTTDEKILWAYEHQSLMERDWFGSTYLKQNGTDFYMLMFGEKMTWAVGTYEACMASLNGPRVMALIEGGQRDLTTGYVYMLYHDTTTGEYWTTNQTTQRYGLLSSFITYDENPEYVLPPTNTSILRPDSLMMGWLTGSWIAGQRGGK